MPLKNKILNQIRNFHPTLWFVLATTFVGGCKNSKFEYLESTPPKDSIAEAAQPRGLSSESAQFFFAANPNPAKVGNQVVFVAQCSLPDARISWNFPDSTKKKGITVKYKFMQAGLYTIEALCIGTDNAPLQSSLDIEVGSQNPSQF